MVAFVYNSPIFNIKHCLLEIKVFKGNDHLPISYRAICHDIRHCFTGTEEMNEFFFQQGPQWSCSNKVNGNIV